MDPLMQSSWPDPAPGRESHIGFNRAAPPDVAWPGGSFVWSLDRKDRFRFRQVALVLTLGYVIPALLAVVAGSAAADMEIESFRKAMSPKMPHFWFLISLGVAFVVFFYHGALLKLYMILAIYLRKGRLFDSGPSSILVSFESLETYEKFKTVPDDYGLLKITPEGFILEMQTHRAFLKKEEVALSVYRKKIKFDGTKDETGHIVHPNLIQPLIVRCNHPEWTWEVIMIPSVQSLWPFKDLTPVARRDILLRKINAIMEIQPPQ